MKIRMDFVTNSSSSSFVISKKDYNVSYQDIKYIEENFHHISSDELLKLSREADVDDVYYLVDYNKDDDYMHIWVRRDEAMYDDNIDDILYNCDLADEIAPKFDYHY